MITDKQAEAAIKYLADTDEGYGKLVGACEAANYQVKVQRDLAFMSAQGTVAERQASAGCNEVVVAAMKVHSDTIGDKEIIKAKRKRAELTIEVWRTQAANQRKGNI